MATLFSRSPQSHKFDIQIMMNWDDWIHSIFMLQYDSILLRYSDRIR